MSKENNTMIYSLELENYRSFRSSRVSFDPHLTVLVGVNGAGKSTLLDAAKLILSWVIARVESSKRRGRSISELDIREGSRYSSLKCKISVRGEGEDIYLARSHRALDSVKPSDLTGANSLAKKISHEHMRYQDGADDASVPVFVAYTVDRHVLDIPLRIRTRHEFEILECYDRALEPATSFRLFFEWFRKQEDIENENMRRMDSSSYLDPQLQAVRSALEVFMPEFTNFRIRRQRLAFLVDKNGATLRVDKLSDGEKNMIGLIGDLARRLAVANPHAKNALDGDGIVLIDEVELHLHPRWQQELLPKLRKTFPNIQFIVSTHSPQVLTSVRAHHVRLLEPGGNPYCPDVTWGLTVTEVLQLLMGARELPLELVERLVEIEELTTEGKLESAEEKLRRLQDEVNGPSEALLRAREQIAFVREFGDDSDF